MNKALEAATRQVARHSQELAATIIKPTGVRCTICAQPVPAGFGWVCNSCSPVSTCRICGESYRSLFGFEGRCFDCDFGEEND